jgi:hypothetical protein
VLVNITLGLPIAVYDQIAAGVTETLKASPGFRTHTAYPVESGFVVTEIWDSAEDHKAFFDSAVKPNLPDGVPFELQVIELHNLIGL